MPQEEKMAAADHLLDNNGPPEAMAGAVEALLQTLAASSREGEPG